MLRSPHSQHFIAVWRCLATPPLGLPIPAETAGVSFELRTCSTQVSPIIPTSDASSGTYILMRDTCIPRQQAGRQLASLALDLWPPMLTPVMMPYCATWYWLRHTDCKYSILTTSLTPWYPLALRMLFEPEFPASELIFPSRTRRALVLF